MKIGIFIDNYYETQRQKDPGIIAGYLASFGHQVTVYCYATDFLITSVKVINKHEGNSVLFWNKENLDRVIIYSWLSLRFSKMIRALSINSTKVILKLDSDGHLLHPFRPTYLRTLGKDNSVKQLAFHFVRLIQWHILFKNISLKKLKQLELSNAYIIESPMALENLRVSLSSLSKQNLIHRSHFIANPINLNLKNDLPQKVNKIICVGRWDDKQKNATGLIRVLRETNLNDWNLELIGRGSKKIARYLSPYHEGKISAYEKIEHELMVEHYRTAKIFFCPSYYESFNLAAAEALLCGCSLAGSPLESFFYFSNGGRFGTISDDFKVQSLKKALLEEMENWSQLKREPTLISEYWNKELSPEKVVNEIEKLLSIV